MHLLVASIWCLLVSAAPSTSPVALSLHPPGNAAPRVAESFVSFAIEFVFFPDFAGNLSHPNAFSYQLLNNLGDMQGSMPVVRVGGNTQDYALLKPSQSEAVKGIIDPTKNPDYPTANVTIGPSFFESYETWPGVKFIHGFNLADTGTDASESSRGLARLACKALGNGKLEAWELGNEPDLYRGNAEGAVRGGEWGDSEYVTEWLGGTRAVREVMQEHCPEMVRNIGVKWSAPSFAGVTNGLDPVGTWNDGLGVDEDVLELSGHNYIGNSNDPSISLQYMLMNHSSTVAAVDKQLNTWDVLTERTGLSFSFTEVNSLYNEGAPGISNTFGAALWGMDFNLYCASRGVARVHMQQGNQFRYNAWQPVQTEKVTMGTKAPYYGSVAVAKMLGNVTSQKVRIVEIEMPTIYEAAYVAYVDGDLARLAVIQMREWNEMGLVAQTQRPGESYSFQIPAELATNSVKVQRLMASGADAISGITFGGYSYNYELEGGKPVQLKNTTLVETLAVASGGVLKLEVPWSSAAVVTFE